MTPRTAAELAKYIDHTLLAPEATRAEVLEVCRNATAWRVAAVCISPSWLPLPVGVVGEGVRVCTVLAFPSGAHTSAMKAAEAAEAVRNGADELDIVVNLGLVRAGDWHSVEADIRAVRSAIEDVAGKRILKVICESAALSDDELRNTCRAAVAGGADFVKTSTGFHKAGGATERAVSIMRETVGNSVGVKASGGIRTTAAALAMIAAGATRIGASATREILAGMTA
ncbi:MAG: deoxyribose-phosphate aldolase [Ilumatobacteraceae bacterium]